MPLRSRPLLAAAATTAVALMPLLGGCGSTTAPSTAAPSASANQSVDLAASQLHFVTVQSAASRDFALQHEAVGNIDFDEDMTVQVSPPWQGRVLQLMARQGDRVRKGQVLLTIDSPDMVQAESTLIQADAQLKLTDAALERAKGLYAIQGIAQKDYEQAVSDQQSAEAAYKAARDAVRIFGKTDEEIDRILARHRVDAAMPVTSPINGVVAARNAAPGTLVQPGGTPAPYTVADVSRKWLLADVPEVDLPSLRLGQRVEVRVMAFPGRTFRGEITNIPEAVDPNTHRATVRSQIDDPGDELRAQMFATFTVLVGKRSSVAVPADAVVREGDGTMSVWVTRDRHRFTRRSVQIGLQQDGFFQILSGLEAGELVATTGALFVSNASIQGGAD